MNDSLVRFQNLLRELFQLDFADLDFGLYRLFRLRAKEVEAFIQEVVPQLVEETFGHVGGEQAEVLKARLGTLRTQIQDELGDEPFTNDGALTDEVEKGKHGKTVRGLLNDYKAAWGESQSAQVSEDRKVEVFNHLYAFFSRYYDNADFIPLPRYGRNETYAVPYSGEEVAFHWATKGMHYIKSATHFQDYRFNVDGSDGHAATVHFRITDANLPTNNTKGDSRYFFPLAEAVEYDSGGNTLTVPFHYRLPTIEEVAALGKGNVQAKIIEQGIPELLGRIQGLALHLHAVLANPASQTEESSLLAKHLSHFTRRANQDYFIHSNLGEFLDRELEFYLKDVVLSLEDLAGDIKGKLTTLQVIRKVGQAIIGFLHQVESAQNRLFEKPKFVLATDWLVTIRFVPMVFWPDILSNESQIAAWTELFGVPKVTDSTFFETYPTLVLDTQYFDAEFKRQLLEALPFESLDEAIDGLLIHGENWQALNLLKHKLAGQVDCIYIDPPYNTGSDEFIYKDRYQHSSWLTMMEERLIAADSLTSAEGLMTVSLNDDETFNFRKLIEGVGLPLQSLGEFVWKTRNTDNRVTTRFSTDHDYIHVFSRPMGRVLGRVIDRSDFKNPDKDKRGLYTTDPLTGKANATDRPNLHYIIVNPDTSDQYLPDPDFGWITDEKGFQDLLKDKCIYWPQNPKTGKPRKKRFLSETNERAPISSLGISITQGEGNQDLYNIMGFKPMNFPKPVSVVQTVVDCCCPFHGTVVDYFGGSGTTAQAVIQANRSDDGKRKFVLVESGEHFQSVLFKRVIRIVFCPDWEDGRALYKPLHQQESLVSGQEDLPIAQPGVEDKSRKQNAFAPWVERGPKLIKVLRLESYEDSLQNLHAAGASKQAGELGGTGKKAGGKTIERLAYLYESLLESSSTLLSVDKLSRPFNYTLEALTPAGPVEKSVDLMETAHWLLGVQVDKLESWEGPGGRPYRVTKGHMNNAGVLIVWRDLNGMDPAADRAFIEQRSAGFERVLVNGDCAMPGAESLDALLFEKFRGPAH